MMQGFSDKPVRSLHERVLILLLVSSLGYAVVAARFIYLQGYGHGKTPASRDLRTARIAPRRGDIFDCNGLPLAVSVDGYDIWVRPHLIHLLKEEAKVVPALAHTLNVPEGAIAASIAGDKRFSFLSRGASHSAGEAVLALRLPGVGADKVFLRTYPQGSMAAQVLGRVDTDDKGTAGVESGLNSSLQGQPGIIQFRVDGKNDPIPGTEKTIQSVRNGQNLRLTLDSRIQQVAERQLEAALEQRHAAAGCTVVVDIKSGAILAMANRPTFNPNLPLTNMGALLNRGISYAYEPGSTLKMVTASGALAEHAWDLHRTVTCPGSMMIGKKKIRCVLEPPFVHGHGTETIRDVIRSSCNVGAATIGMKLGGPKLYDYICRFGLLDRPRIGLPGAVAYRLSGPETWAKMRLANISFGQGVLITPLQMVMAYAAIANRGLLMKPEIVAARVDADTGLTERNAPTPIRQALPAATAQEVVNILKAVVYDGTGKPAQIPGYQVAGKTGSAQKSGPHGYLDGKFIASFVGFAPASRPKVACITMIDEPQGEHWGAVCAAPVVREVLRWSLHYLQAPPDAPQLTGDGSDAASLQKEKESKIPLPGAIAQSAQSIPAAPPRHTGSPETPDSLFRPPAQAWKREGHHAPATV